MRGGRTGPAEVEKGAAEMLVHTSSTAEEPDVSSLTLQ